MSGLHFSAPSSESVDIPAFPHHTFAPRDTRSTNAAHPGLGQNLPLFVLPTASSSSDTNTPAGPAAPAGATPSRTAFLAQHRRDNSACLSPLAAPTAAGTPTAPGCAAPVALATQSGRDCADTAPPEGSGRPASASQSSMPEQSSKKGKKKASWPK